MAKRKLINNNKGLKENSAKLSHQTDKKPLSPEQLQKLASERKFNMTHHEVNYGNVLELTLKMLSNMNTNITEMARDVAELKKMAKGE